MPVNFAPVILLFLAIVIPLSLALLKRFRASIGVVVLEIVLLVVYLLSIYMPGWRLEGLAERGDPVAQFQYSRWCRSVTIAGQQLIDVSASLNWLERSADQGYPPAIYTLGVKYKYGEEFPGHSGLFPQPDKGQPLIDKALALGFTPPIAEDLYYRTWYTVPDRSISPGAQWLQSHKGKAAGS